MPEGPEVAIVADKLKDKCINIEVYKLEFLTNKYIDSIFIYNNYLINYLKYRTTISNIHSKGKNLFIKLTNEYGSVYIHSHLAMTGRWCYNKSKHTKVIIYSNDFNIYYEDIRGFGKFNIINEEQYIKCIDSIGCDILKNKLDYETWYKVISDNGNNNNKNITVILMDQKYISGIGNYLKSEILYKSKINPNSKFIELDETKLLNLYNNIYDISKQSYDCNGLTISDFIDPNGNKGIYNTLVYNRNYDSYNNKVLTIKTKDGRTTYYVPTIQI